MGILIGSDPEAFLVDDTGAFHISVGRIGGSKHEPQPVPGGAVQEDNVLAEFNTTPAATAEEFYAVHQQVISELEAIVAPLKLWFGSSHEFTADEIYGGGDQALTLGCEPDYNCWTNGGVNDKPNGFATFLRTAGGHVHIGYDDPTPEQSIEIIKACDFMLGIPSVLLDGDNRRRELYGCAGSYRPKSYGVEYRVLSNFWVASETYTRWVFETAKASVGAASKVGEWCTAFSHEEVVRIINTGDVEAAANVVAVLGLDMPEVF